MNDALTDGRVGAMQRVSKRVTSAARPRPSPARRGTGSSTRLRRGPRLPGSRGQISGGRTTRADGKEIRYKIRTRLGTVE